MEDGNQPRDQDGQIAAGPATRSTAPLNIWTFGHSTLDIQPASDLLRANGCKVLVDVRSHPMSRWEQWRYEQLQSWVPKRGITYMHEPRLGGWTSRHLELADSMRAHGVDVAAYSTGKFPKHRIGVDRPAAPDSENSADSANSSWTNQGLWDYQWYMTLPEFRDAVHDLIALAVPGRRCAIMCGELLWWKCHRSMVADALWACTGRSAVHMQPKRAPHTAQPRMSRYDPGVIEKWREWGWNTEAYRGPQGLTGRQAPC